MALGLAILAIVTAAAFLFKQPVFFIAAGIIATFTGLAWYDTYGTSMGLAIALSLLMYGLISLALAFRYMLWTDIDGKLKE